MYSSLVPAKTADVVLGRNDAKPEARAELGLIDAAKPIGWDGNLVGGCVAMGMVMTAASAMPTPPALEIDVLCDMGNSRLWSGLMDKGSRFLADHGTRDRSADNGSS